MSRAFKNEHSKAPGVKQDDASAREADDGLTIVSCGPPKCEHDWSGPEVEIGGAVSVTCAKCGWAAYSVDMWG